MRQALNDNPVVQAAVLGVIAVAFAVLIFTSFLKKDPEAEGSAATPAAPTAEAGATVAPPAIADAAVDSGTGTPAGAPPVDGAAAPPATGSDPGASAGLAATEGLPKNVVAAYEQDKAIVLLVIDPKAQESFPGRGAVKGLSDGDVEVVVVDVKDVAKYSRITLGVAVSRTPALVVLRPRKLTDSVPTASVEYDLTGIESVKQAIHEAFYDGGTVSAYP